jgi:sugar/nucleoside kinase (ribokinase family)
MDTIWKLDSKARPRGASNYATVQTNVGGVGANLAIAVARSDLSRRPTFITTLGDDSPGAFLEDRLAIELDLIKVNRRNDFFLINLHFSKVSKKDRDLASTCAS